jgi:hypothetical protein
VRLPAGSANARASGCGAADASVSAERRQ